MGKFIAGLVFAIIVAVVAGYAVITTGTIPAGAGGANPLPLERWAAKASLTATLKREAPNRPNPVKLNDANLIAGIKLFQQHCAICHGGPKGNAAPTPISKGEYPSPPQLASAGVEDDPESWTFWKIENGIRWTGMPAWRSTLPREQAWTLALFLKHMNKLPPGPEAVWKHSDH
ncbi:MAG: c-type cytochrome [Stellaceae bacterium]